MNIRKIIREEIEGFNWIKDETPSDELLHGGEDTVGGYYWHIESYTEWEDLYNNLKSVQDIKPMWYINPIFKSRGMDISKYFDRYQEKYGDFNIFLPHGGDNIYGWFDKMDKAFDSKSVYVEKPI
jgi:hypothetical protein